MVPIVLDEATKKGKADLDAACAYLTPDERKLVNKAFEVACIAHDGVFRRSGEPYVTHPVWVATLVASWRMDVSTICAALLHDVLEDTTIPRSELAQQFGEEIVFIVDGCSKITRLNKGFDQKEGGAGSFGPAGERRRRGALAGGEARTASQGGQAGRGEQAGRVQDAGRLKDKPILGMDVGQGGKNADISNSLSDPDRSRLWNMAKGEENKAPAPSAPRADALKPGGLAAAEAGSNGSPDGSDGGLASPRKSKEAIAKQREGQAARAAKEREAAKERKEKEAALKATFDKLMSFMMKDYRVVIVKIADRMHNMSTLASMPPRKQVAKSMETLQIYASLAVRFGMDKIAEQLQNMAFSYVRPYRSKVLAARIEKTKELYRESIGRFEEVVGRELKEKGVRAEFIVKVKSPYRFYDKMKSKHLTFEEIKNFISVVIVLDNVDDCFVALGATHKHFQPKFKEVKDYINSPLSTGYQSLHTTVSLPGGREVRVYIRTREMNARAEMGILGLDVYETSKTHPEDIPETVRSFFETIVRLKEEANDPDEFYNMALNSMDSRQIVVYTPERDFKMLPVNSTPVDFAYAVNTALGNSCIGALVNGLRVPLDVRLQHGDVVKVVSAPGARPNPNWLDSVATNVARSQINRHLREQSRNEAVGMGWRYLHSYLDILEKGVPESELVEAYCKAARPKIKNFEDVLYDIGIRKISALSIATDIHQLVGKRFGLSLKNSVFEVNSRNVARLRFDQSHRPIPEDPIKVVFDDPDFPGPATVYRADSPVLPTKKTPVVDAKWGQFSRSRTFKTDVCIVAKDSRGMLKRMVDAVTKNGVNIISCNSRDLGCADKSQEVLFCLEVRSERHWSEVEADIKSVSEVIDVRRL